MDTLYLAIKQFPVISYLFEVELIMGIDRLAAVNTYVKYTDKVIEI